MAVQFAFIIEDVKAKAKTRWYYDRFPKPVVKAFTLAEILLTLTIIAVVASLTIPALVQSEQQAYFNTGVWNAYSMLSQTLISIQTSGGLVHTGNNDNGVGLRNDFCNVMQCVQIDTSANIFGPTNYLFYKGGTTGWPGADSAPAVKLNNGSYIRFASMNGCANNNYGSVTNICGWMTIDINGSQGPNMAGADWFSFWLVLNNGAYSIVPEGASDTYICSNNYGVGGSWGNSNGCTYQRLYNPNNMP